MSQALGIGHWAWLSHIGWIKFFFSFSISSLVFLFSSSTTGSFIYYCITAQRDCASLFLFAFPTNTHTHTHTHPTLYVLLWAMRHLFFSCFLFSTLQLSSALFGSTTTRYEICICWFPLGGGDTIQRGGSHSVRCPLLRLVLWSHFFPFYLRVPRFFTPHLPCFYVRRSGRRCFSVGLVGEGKEGEYPG